MFSITKKCIKCGIVKPLSGFYKHSGFKSGFNSTCKACELDRQRKLNRPPKLETHKKCIRCGETKPGSSFSLSKRSLDGLDSKCKACAAAWQRRYRKENPELIRETKKKYRKEHPEVERVASKRYYYANPERHRKVVNSWVKRNIERVKEARDLWRETHPDNVRAMAWNRRKKVKNAGGNGITGEQWKELKDSYLNRCVYCGKKLELTLDHIIPLDGGGDNDIDNAAPACKICNSKKGVKSLLLFLYRQLTK